MYRDSSSPPQRRSLRLNGDAVSRWFAEQGWSAALDDVGRAHAFIDELTAPGLRVRRIWHTAVTVTGRPGDASEEGSVVWLQAGGSTSVTWASGEIVTMAPHAALFLQGMRPMAVSTRHPAARIEVNLHTRTTGASAYIAGSGTPTPAWSALAAVANSFLNAAEPPDDRVAAFVRMSIDALLHALHAECEPARRPVRSVSPHLYARAAVLLHERARDPRLTIADVAAELGVTRAHLSRLFRERGTSPTLALRRERLAVASAVIASDPDADLAAVAAASGFPSRRALREHLSQ